MNNKGRATVVLGLAGLILAGSALSPYYTLHRIGQALQQHDADALAEYVDFPALRQSFKTQLLAAMHLSDAQRQSSGTLAGIGQALAASLVGPLVDTMISPAGLSIMLATGYPSSLAPAAREDNAGKVEKGSESNAAEPHPHRFAMHYQSWNRFVFQPRTDGSAAKFTLSRQGWFTWKVSAIELPPDFKPGQ